MSATEYDDDGFPACAAEIEWVIQENGIRSARDPYWIKNPRGPFSRSEMAVFQDIADRARKGEKAAQQKAARMVAAAMSAGVVAPPFVAQYVGLALGYFGRGEASLGYAFAPLKRPPPDIARRRRERDDDLVVEHVEQASSRGLAKSKDGELGDAFIAAAASLAAASTVFLSPAGVKGRYYEVKDDDEGIKRRQERKRIQAMWAESIARVTQENRQDS